ncbi:hypothetical protein MKEN_00206200 [Mycena kentingensis (nom. inval.)]|nr:hypothetical protein MKEN_00206200 [Mycena kentingensis (nom. inval.)]
MRLVRCEKRSALSIRSLRSWRCSRETTTAKGSALCPEQRWFGWLGDLGASLFETSPDELSYLMVLVLRVLSSSLTTSHHDQHTIDPCAQWFSDPRSDNSLFRGSSFLTPFPPLHPLRLPESDFSTLRRRAQA